MSMYSDDYEYAHSRLSETIVRLEETPIFVFKVSPGMKVQYAPLSALDNIGVCDIDALNLQPVPLGYCNYNKHACYLSRMPMRRDWRQGLRRGNFTSLSGVDPQRIPYDAIHQVIVGDYPTFKAALGSSKKVKSIAWHRHWALDTFGQILYKGGERPVGKIVNGEPELDTRYKHLSEALKESL